MLLMWNEDDNVHDDSGGQTEAEGSLVIPFDILFRAGIDLASIPATRLDFEL